VKKHNDMTNIEAATGE